MKYFVLFLLSVISDTLCIYPSCCSFAIFGFDAIASLSLLFSFSLFLLHACSLNVERVLVGGYILFGGVTR